MKLSRRLYLAIVSPALMLAVIWAVFLAEHLLAATWADYGVFPREQSGLKGVLFMPLLHGDWGHILSNTPPLAALMAMLWFFYPRVASPAFFMIYLLSGLATWTFARAGVFHIGASGVVYGLVAFLFWNGIFRRNFKAIVIALIVLFYYGGLFMGIVPGQAGISWDGHLMGALAGVVVAYVFRNYIEKDEHRQPASWELEEPEPPRSFLPSDVFDKTKSERGIW
jgi:membrane associated rhomboid family serine protease